MKTHARSLWFRFLVLCLCVTAFVGFLLCPAPVSAAEEPTFYVSPDGDDGAAGTKEAPFATPAGALGYLRAHKKDLPDGAAVVFRGGDYALSEELAFTADDLPHVTFRGYENEEVVFSAARPLSGFRETTVNGVRAFSLQTDLTFTALYHATEGIHTPRLPKTGSFTVKSVDHADDLFTAETTYWESSRGNTSFNADPKEVGIDFAQPERVWCRITHGWLDEIAPIRFYEAATGKVGLGRPATFETKPGDVYWFENVFEALDAPGEWYLDTAAKTLYYVPFENETAEGLTLYAPVSPYIMRIDGCSGLTFENIRFARSEWTLAVPTADGGVRSEYNIDAYQASTESDSAVNVLNAEGITFKNCEFIDIGNTALKFVKNCRDCTVENCIFRRVGSTGIAVYGENAEPGAENAAEAMGGFRIVNNLVEAYGRNTYESVGVHIMYAADCEVSHNEIHDGYYTGLSCGWIWGHEYQVTKNVHIANNLIYDIGQGWLSDLGGMYLLGEQKGTVIERNVIYNVTRGKGKNDYGGNGIYTDAGSSYFTIRQNLIYDCAATGLNIGGYNKDHTVKNNIVAFCKLSAFDPGWGDGNADDHTADCTGNIFYADNAPVLLDVTKKAAYTESGNLMWDETNKEKIFGSDGYSGDYANKTKISARYAKKNGYFLQDVIADPLFADPAARDFSLLPDSPALTGQIEFIEWDVRAAGLLKDTPVGCGSAFTPGNTARVSNLSAYENACGGHPVSYAALRQGEWLLPALILLCLLCSLFFSVRWIKKEADLSRLKKLLAVVCPAAALLLLPLLYYSFVVRWQMVLYGVSLALLVVFSVLPAFLSFRRLWLRLLCGVFAVGLSMGLTFLLNNVLHLGESVALFSGVAVLAVYQLVCSLLRLKKPEERS